MKVVVFDDGGLMGVETALSVRDHGHEVDLISAAKGFDSLTREEIARSLRDCSVVIDVSHQLSLGTGIITDDHGLVMDEEALAASWRLSTSALLQAETAAGVTHHVSLSVVGADRIRSEGVFRAVQAQEVMIQRSGIAYSIVRSTQTFESAEDIATTGTEDRMVWVRPVDVRPVSLTDVATLLAHTAVSRPLIGVREIAGPEQFRLDAFVYRPHCASGVPPCLHGHPQPLLRRASWAHGPTSWCRRRHRADELPGMVHQPSCAGEPREARQRPAPGRRLQATSRIVRHCASGERGTGKTEKVSGICPGRAGTRKLRQDATVGPRSKHHLTPTMHRRMHASARPGQGTHFARSQQQRKDQAKSAATTASAMPLGPDPH
ncbi:hypothetical protein AB0L10_15775 [Streptomyces flaveolus]|uniref:SDR family oxidoreductase n=1 Tax=Streptomyces flaveolus TaxID=67297 RepID=UPI00341BF5FB